MIISIVHPSRGRAKKAFEVAEKWIKNAGCPVEYILSIDVDDPQMHEYLSQEHHGCVRRIMVCKPNKNAIEAINRGARESRGYIIVAISDDFDCPQDWGKQILDATEGKEDWIMKTPDGIQDWIITLPIMDRIYYERFNYIYHPSYHHGWCDTDMTCVAELTGRKIFADIPFRHLHYSVVGGKDEVNERADSHFEHGREIFSQRIKANFYLHDIRGKLSDNFYTRMKHA